MSVNSHSKKSRSYKGSFNSSIGTKKDRERNNILNTKFSVNSNFLNKLKLKNLNNLVKRTSSSQKGIQRVISYKSKNQTTFNSNPRGNSKMLHLTLNSNPHGTNVVQINNYLSAGARKLNSGKPPSIGGSIGGVTLPKKSASVRNHKVKEVVRRTGYRDGKNLKKYRKILIDSYHEDYSSKVSRDKSTTGSRKRTHTWKAQFENYKKH